ncbi:MAG TPA: hypothetical protein VIB00_03720 [Pyrinomonadaceae bacterium]|jgi:type II secretory pathway pseudopilin PulG
MNPKTKFDGQEGFSIVEMLIAITAMVVVSSAVFSLMGSSMRISTAAYEITDAQENLRTAQEFINRDLMNAGDGLNSINNILVTPFFQQNYLTLTPVNGSRLAILTSDNSVPAGTVVRGSNPTTTVRSDRGLTDRQTILEIDHTFTPEVTPLAINSDGDKVTITGTEAGRFRVGEIYFLTSANGATFGTITDISPNGANTNLEFATGDTFGLNVSGPGGNIEQISEGGTIATSLRRMKIIHYYVNSSGLLMRRVFGVQGTGFTESAIAEHVLNVQFVYSLSLTDSSGNVVQPTPTLSTAEQQTAVRQVEVTVTVETARPLANGLAQLSMTTATSVRNMQFRQARQPTA